MSNNDLLISVRRTVVPLIVGLVAGSFLGPYIDPVELERVVTAVISIGYYTVIRIIERRLPAVGLLLGSKKQPTYLDGPVP
jgi:hypothetical protein